MHRCGRSGGARWPCSGGARGGAAVRTDGAAAQIFGIVCCRKSSPVQAARHRIRQSTIPGDNGRVRSVAPYFFCAFAASSVEAETRIDLSRMKVLDCKLLNTEHFLGEFVGIESGHRGSTVPPALLLTGSALLFHTNDS